MPPPTLGKRRIGVRGFVEANPHRLDGIEQISSRRNEEIRQTRCNAGCDDSGTSFLLESGCKLDLLGTKGMARVVRGQIEVVRPKTKSGPQDDSI